MTIIQRLLGRDIAVQEERELSFTDWWGAGLAPDSFSPVAPGTGGYSMANAAQWACVGLKGDQIASMPIKAYRRSAGGSSIELPDQPALLTKPSEYLSQSDWVFAAVAGIMLNGNAIGVVTRRGPDGKAAKVEWLDSGLVQVDQNPDYSLTYRVGSVSFTAAEVLHIRGITVPGQIMGLSPVAVLRQTFESGTYAQTFGHGFFKAGGHPSAVLSSENVVTQEQADTVKTRWLATVKAGNPVVLGNGFKYAPITVNPDDSQFLEAQKFSATQVARVHRIPPEMIGAESGSSMTYANVEAQSIHFLTYSIRPDLRRIEQVLDAALPGPQFTKFNAGALLRTDLKTRYESYKLGLEAGFITVAQIWEWEDWGPVPDTLTTASAVAQLEEIT